MLVVVVSGLGDAGKWLSPTLYHTLLVRSQGSVTWVKERREGEGMGERIGQLLS